MPEENKSPEPKKTTAKTPVVAIKPFSLSGNPNGETFHSDQISDMGVTGTVHSALGNTDFGNSKYDDLSTKTEHIQSGNYEFMRGERQSALTQIGSGVVRVGLKAVVEALKTPAYLYALGEAAMTDKTLDQTLDNAYLNGLEGAENSWKAAGSPLAVHKSFKSGKGGLMDNIASTSFWASEGADGVGYMVGMVGGSYGVGLLGLAPKLAKVALKLGVKNALKASSIGAKLELGVQTTLNTATESLAEAKGVGDRIRNDFKDMLNPESQNYNPINPATGKNWTEQEVASSIADGSKSTFYLNTLILFGPNMIMNKNLLGRFNKDKKLLDNFRDASGKLSINPLLKKQFIKDYSKALGIAMVSEGPVEEGGQFSIENYEVKRATGKTSDTLIKGLIKEYGNTWNSLEGQKSILLGSVIGGLAGVAGQYRKNKQLSELKPVINKMIANNFTGVMDNLDIFERDDNNRIKNDNNNQPVINEQKALAYFYSLANEAGESQVRDLAAFDSNKLLYDYIAHKQFVRWSSQFIQQGDLGLEILDEHIDNAANTQEIIDKKDLSLGQGTSFSETGYKQQLKKKARDLHASYNETLDVLKGLPFLEEFTKNNPKEAGSYINDLANAVYQENAKQVFYKEKIQDLSKELIELNSSLSSDLPQNQAIAEKIRKDVANTVLLLEKSKEDYKAIFSEEQQILAFNQHIKDSKVEEEISKESRKFATGSNVADGENKTNDPGDQSAEIINYNNNNTEKLNTINNFADFNLLKEEAKESPYHNTETSKQFAAKEKQLNDAVNVFANAIIKNTVENTPENQEFFANNSKEIEAKVQQLKDAAMPKKTFDELLAEKGIVNEEMPPVLTQEKIDEEQEIVSLANVQGSYSSNEKTQNETQESINSIQSEKGINARVNVIMVRLFEHYFDNKVFRFIRDNFGFPKIDNSSKVNITALNALKKGDKVTLELVKLTKAEDDPYKFFKDDQNNFIPVNHIAIKHNGELVGFVMQPHPVSVESLDPVKSEELRKQLIDYRKKVISLINQGITVTEEVQAKGTGNLYTKLKEGNPKEPASTKFIDNKFDVFSDSRPQDKADGSLIFVYANAEGKIKLPDSSVSDLNASDIVTINKRLNEFSKFRTKPGQVYQLVKDLTGQWSPIPVYANNINDKTTDAIEEILNTFDDSSNEKDIVRALQPYVYSSKNKQGAMLLVKKEGGKIILSSNRNDISLNDFNNGTALTKKFLLGMKGLAQNIDVTNINNPVVQQKMADRGTLITNVTTFNGEYFVQPYVEFSFNSMTEEKPAITDNQINKLSAVQPSSTPSTSVSTDVKADIEKSLGIKLSDYLAYTMGSSGAMTWKQLLSMKDNDGNNIPENERHVIKSFYDLGDDHFAIGYKANNSPNTINFQIYKKGNDIAVGKAFVNSSKEFHLISSKTTIAQEKIVFLNKKYDAEFAALEKPTTTTEDIEARKADIEKRIQEEISKADMFHGTSDAEGVLSGKYDIDSAMQTAGQEVGAGLYLANNKERAKNYSEESARQQKVKGKIIGKPSVLYFNSKDFNILKSDKSIGKEVFNKVKEKYPDLSITENTTAKELYNKIVKEEYGVDFTSSLDTSDMVPIMVELGIDGINFKSDTVIYNFKKIKDNEINAKYNALITKLSEIKPSKVTSEEDDFLNDLNDIKNVKIDENGAASKSIDNTVLNRVLFEKWLKKNLPQLSLSEITDINELKDTIIDAFGLFKDSTIFLFEGAGNKTAYHEAFHGVFRNLLTVKQREELINEAKTKYPAPTLEDLNNLQKDLKNQYTEQQLTNLYYEEQLSDAFAIFSNDKNSKSLLGKLSDAIVRFFNKILRYFNLLQNNDLSKIENLFDNINNGKLATMKSKSNSVVNIPIFSEYAYSKVLNEQLTVSIAAATVKTVGDLFMAKYQNNLISNKKTSPVEAFQSIVDDYIAKFKTLPKGSVDKAVCGKIILNFPELIIEAKKYLSSRSVKIKSKISYTEKIGTLTSLEDNSSVEFFNELELNKLSDYEVNTMESKTVKGLAEWTSISGLSSASARLRLFLSSIPVLSTRKSNGAYTSLTDRFGMQIYHDFNELYTYIEDNLIDLYEFEEQIEKLQELSVNRPELKQVIDKLTNKSSDYNNDQFNLLQNDFNTNFSKQQLEYSLAKFDTDAATGQTTIRIIDANRTTLGKQISDKWKSNVFDNNRNTIGSYNDQKESVINVAKAKRLEDSWNGLPEKPKASVVNAKLLQAGIEYSESALNQLIEQNDPEWKKDVSIVLNYYSSNLNPANEKAFREALYRLVSKEVELVPSRHSKSFISGTNENIFTVQLPSFISKTIAKIKNVGKFKTWSNELSKDLFYKNSGILKMLKGNSAFRLKLKVSYIDALKDERGTREGVHFTDMTPKDYAACQIAYFQNIAVNKQKDIAGVINKYFYIIGADKSMQVIIDSTSTQAKVDSKGKLLVVKSPIINNGQDELSYYNHFLQEAHRIKVNLDIKNDIILNKGKGKHKLNSLLENYHMSKDNFTELSKLILKDELSEEDVKQLSNMFDGFAYKFNYFSNDFNKNVLPSLMKIIDSSTIDNLESNLDSNDNVQFKGNVINAIAKEIQSDFNKTLEEMIDNGVILYNEKTKLYSSKIITLEEKINVVDGQKIQRTEQDINDDILNVLVNFSANTKLNNMEFSNIFNGDIAQYKAKELGKRTPQSQAMTVFGRFKNKIMKTRVVKDFYYKLDKEKRDDIYNSLIDNGLRPEEAKEIIDQYLNVNTTDAQVYISPELYKRIHESRGTWTPLMQEAYDIAESGDKKAMTPEVRRQLLGIKPFYFGNRFNEDLGIMQFEQVKCSMIPLFKSYTDLNPLLADIRKDMLKKDKNGNTTLDMVAHESAFKDALGFRNDIFDSTGSVTLDLNTDNFGIQVDNVDHIEGGNDSTRQLKMLILGTVDKNKTYRGVPGSEIIDTITRLEATNIRTSLAELKTKLDIKNNAEFGTFIADAITKRNATVNVEESLSLEDGDFKYALDGSLSVQIENLISSVYTSNAIKQEFEVGGDAVQATSLGFQVKSKFKNLLEQQKNLTKDELTIQKRLEWIKPNKENGYIEFAECAMPAWTSKFFDEKGFLIDAKNIPEALRQLIIYRIPTEGLHSMLPIRVVEFLPPTMGNFILLPLEITKQFGSDFDFDKVYFIGKDFYKTINENKEVVFEEYKYYANEEDTALRYGQYIRYANKKRVYPMDFEFFAKLPIEEQNPKASRDNEIINQYFNILTELSNLNLLIKPSGFDALVDFKNDNFETKQEVDFFSSNNQREIKKRSHTSITIKGQAALHVSGHSFGVLMDLNTASYIKEKQKDGTYKSYLDLNKTINIDGKKRTDFHKLYNDSGKLIANELGSLLAATLDDLKFDILAYLNINSYTIDTLATIMRSGVTTNDSLTFIGQPALKELAKALEGNENKIKEFNQGRIDVDTLISIYKNKAKSILDKLEDRDNPEVSDLYDKIEDPNFYVSTKEIFKYVNNFDFNEFEKTASPKELLNYFSNQARVLIQFKSAEIISKELVKANKFFAINKEVGPNIEDIISKQYILEDLENSKILNGFDLERNPSLNETWKVHLDALQWFSSYFPYGSESYKGVKEMFAFQQGSKNISEYPVKDRQYMNSFIRTFVDHGSDLFKDVNKEYDNLLKTLPALVNKIFAFTDEEMFLGTISYNSLRNNPFLKELKEYNDKDNDNYYLQLKGTRLELQIKNNVIAGLTALYNSVDPEVKNFAIDLIKHSFLTTGFFKGINSFSTLINPEILNELGYNQFRKNVIEELRIKGPLLSEKTIVEEMIMNNPRSFSKTFDPIMFIQDSTEGLPSTITTNINLINAAKRTGDMQWTDEDGVTRNPMIISVIDKAKKMIKLFKRNDNVGVANDMNEVANIVYNEITPLGKNGCVIEINILETPKKSQLPDNDRGISSTDESTDVDGKITPVIPDGKKNEEVVTEVNVATENKESPLPTTQPSTQPQVVLSTSKKLTQEEADWLMNNLRQITEKYKSSTLAGSKDIELKTPIIIGKTKVTHIDPEAGGTPSIIFERPSGKWMIKIREKNNKMYLELFQWRDANVKGEFSFYVTDDSTGNDLENIKKSGLFDLATQLYNDTNIPDPGTRLGQFETANSLQQKYGLKRTYKDIINELKVTQPSTSVKSNLSNINTNNSLFRPDTKIKEKHFKNSNTVKVSEILDTISESNHPLSALAARLKSFSSINNVNVNLLPVSSFTKEVEIESAAYFSVDKNEINIAEFTNVKKGESEALLLHEILHALSYNALRKNGEYNQDFKKLYNYSIDKLKGFDVESEKGTYANHTIDEFFVSLFTDSNFIKQLKELPPIDIKKSDNLFEEIFDMILKYLGIEKGDSAYKQAFSVATNILEEERFNVNRSEDLFEMQKYEDSLNLNIETLDSPKFIDWYNNELQNNPDLDAEEALEYYKKCKS